MTTFVACRKGGDFHGHVNRTIMWVLTTGMAFLLEPDTCRCNLVKKNLICWDFWILSMTCYNFQNIICIKTGLYFNGTIFFVLHAKHHKQPCWMYINFIKLLVKIYIQCCKQLTVAKQGSFLNTVTEHERFATKKQDSINSEHIILHRYISDGH